MQSTSNVEASQDATPRREDRHPPRLHRLHHHLHGARDQGEGRQAVQAQAKHACSQKARARGHPAVNFMAPPR
eukprot:3798757-Prymnesium_polylepis.1